MEARLPLGSDAANGDSGHGSNESWEGQRTVAEVGGGSRTGLRARLGRGKESEVAF